MPDRLFALGDIHGCSTALGTLIAAIEPQPEDTLVVLGDVIDYGPDTKGVIQQLIELSRRCRLILMTGNHEEMMFRAFESPSELNSWIYSGGEDTLKCYPGRDENELIDPDHFDFLKRECRDYHETDEFIFVHANYFPNLPMSQQSSRTLRWEFLEPERMVPHYSGKTVIAGHTPQTSGEILDLGFLKVIDTDCSRGGWLTALEVRAGNFIQSNQGGEVRTGNLSLGVNTSGYQTADRQARESGSVCPRTMNFVPERSPKVTIWETESSQEIVTELPDT